MAVNSALRDELHRMVDELDEENLPLVLRVLREAGSDEASWLDLALHRFAEHFGEDEAVYTESDARPRPT
ncbi:MAG: hypothetical protein ACSLFM_10225 [Tepidiformaceae bacterium]